MVSRFTKFSAPSWCVLWCALLACAVAACDAGDDSLARRGRVVYETYCIACHARDPAQAGAIGPPLLGSSFALLSDKVLRNVYPPGYTPQRESNAMVPFPHLEEEMPALHAYLSKAQTLSPE